MKNELAVAIEKSKIKTDKLPVGKHSVNGLVRVIGEIEVKEDQQVTPTASILSVDFLLLTLRAAGVTREAALNAISNVAQDYLVDWTGSDADKKAAKKARKAAIEAFDPEGKGKEAFDNFKLTLPKVPRAGAVTFEGSITEVEASATDALIEVA
ncbi:MAG: hypothetical protein PHI12_10995 [Dehalococcoidales bacterium]|nr:hypothetical protein [Dehalococcoidales bacterium]